MPEFDEQGNAVPGTETQGETNEETVQEAESTETEVEATEEVAAAPTADEANYRIGDKTFKTLAEAHAYATQQEQETAEVDAYRRVLREIVTAPAQTENVTPQADDFNEDEYYANPKEFLKKFATNVQQQTVAAVQNQAARTAADEAVWREFTSRHPNLADFREDVERAALANQTTVQTLNKNKGAQAAYDFVALRVRAEFERRAEALKPTRTLPNGGNSSVTAAKVPSVTPKKVVRKPLSFVEQIRQAKPKGR